MTIDLRSSRALCVATLATLALLVASARLAAQVTAASAQGATVSPASRMATRAELESAAAEFDQLAASTAYSEPMRARARGQAVAIRRRLTEGDFRVGDLIVLRIEGQLTVNDTMTVLDGLRVSVPQFRQVSLAGVLRSELELRLRTELTDVVRNATVTARPLMRLAVLGSVTRPGYLSVPSETTVDGLLMLAGGPLPTAAVNEMNLTRADTVLLKASTTRSAVTQGLTIGQLELTDGDALLVPLKERWDRAAVLQIVGLAVTLLTTFTLLQQLP